MLLGCYQVHSGLGINSPSPFAGPPAARRILAVRTKYCGNLCPLRGCLPCVYGGSSLQIPLVLVVALAMLTASLLLPLVDPRTHALQTLFWLCAVLLCVVVMVSLSLSLSLSLSVCLSVSVAFVSVCVTISSISHLFANILAF